MGKLSLVDYIALILVIVGGLNWGLVGVFDLNLVTMLFGDATLITRIVYGLVGLSAIYLIYAVFKSAR